MFSTTEDTAAYALKITERFNAYGFTRQEYIHFFVAWSIFFGEGFEEKDPQGLLQEICHSTESEDDRFVQFKNRFDSFTIRRMEAS